jgi:hypothetical protein
MSDAISKAAAALGKRGGVAGTGKAKARSKEHYRLAGIKSGEARRLAADIRVAHAAKFDTAANQLREVQNFHQLRGLHNRGKIGDCLLRTAHRNAVAAIKRNKGA